MKNKINNKNIPTRLERVLMYLMNRSKTCRKILHEALGEAYDLGVRAGMLELSKNKGKKMHNKVKKIIKKDAYKSLYIPKISDKAEA